VARVVRLCTLACVSRPPTAGPLPSDQHEGVICSPPDTPLHIHGVGCGGQAPGAQCRRALVDDGDGWWRGAAAPRHLGGGQQDRDGHCRGAVGVSLVARCRASPLF